MKIKSLLLLLIIFLFCVSCTVQNKKFERETNFNANWKFIRSGVESAEQTRFRRCSLADT